MIEHELFAAALTRLRGERTRRELAQVAGIHAGTWSQYEAGRRLPRETQTRQMLDALGCTSEALELALWTALSDRLRSRHGVEMVKALVSEERRNLLTLDLQRVPPASRAELALQRDWLFQLSLQVDHLGEAFEALIGRCCKVAAPHDHDTDELA